jgi:hypothetical protein
MAPWITLRRWPCIGQRERENRRSGPNRFEIARKTGIVYWQFPLYWLNQQPRETFGIGLAGCYL